ncbi:MAG: CHAT domain-containing protein, partial [Bacteroidetes bacterium]|nr:CHAT domain-containing protein [Bacteroidota bacterium]
HLPDWFYNSAGLEFLYLENNHIKELSENIAALYNLKVLHLKDNSLSRLPESIQSLTALQPNNQEKDFQNGFTITGNPFDFILPKELLNDDPEKIIDFILAQQVEVIGEVEEKRTKSKEAEQIFEVEEETVPVIFLAYANQIDHSRHLRNLAQELRDVRKSLSAVVRTGSVEIVERVDATINDIIDVFQDPLYSGRIAIFHYGGHAESLSFLLGESEMEKGGRGFGRFLANQEGLKMVFLSGCGSERQTSELIEQGVPVVISTFDNIADHIAQRFTSSFYRRLAEFHSIEESFAMTEKEMIVMTGSDSRSLYVEGVSEKGNDYDTPWRMMSRINTNMSWRLQVEIDEIPDAIDPAYAHLFCDRVEQVYKFRIQMSERLLGSKRQPIPVIIHGPDEELHRSLIERLKLEYQDALKSLK